MYIVRRVAKTLPGKAWEVAGLLNKIVEAYEEAGRTKARIYISGQSTPGNPPTVYAEWTQERIEPTDMSKVPASVRENNAKMQELLTEYSIEFYELATQEKMKARGVA